MVFRAKVGTWQTTISRNTPQVDELFEFTVPGSAAPNSTMTLEATAVDAKGTDVSAPPVQLNVLDTAGPNVTITGATTGLSVKPGQQTTVVVTAADPGLVKALTFKATGAAVYQADRTISPAQDQVVASFTFTISPTAHAPEQVTLEATATDVAGNVASATVVKLQVADVSAPSVVSLSTSSGSTVIVPGSALLVQVTATDDIEVTQIALTGTGAFPVNQTKTYSPGQNQESHTFSIQVPQDLPTGALLNLQARATDRAGNVSQPALLTLTADAVPTVSFVNAPYIVKAGSFVMATFTLSAPAPAGGRTVTFASDNAAIAEVVATVTVPAGQSSGTVKVTANAGGSAAVIASIDGAERGRATATVLGGIVSGVVTDPQGLAAIGAAVTVSSGGQSFPAQTDGEGRFEIQGAPGPNATVKAFASGLYGTATTTMASYGHATVNVQLIDAAPVVGAVVKADTQTSAGANVKVSIYAGANLNVDPLASTFTKDDGSYEFPLVESGSYTLEAYGADGNRARSTVTIVPGIESNVKLTFLARGTIKGQVRDALEHAVGADLTLKVTSLFGATTTNATTPDGSFQFDNVFAGTFTLSASRTATGEAGTASGGFDLDGAQVEILVHLSAVGTLEGTIYRGTSVVPNATVTVGTRSTTTDSLGHYELLIPAGGYTVEASVDATKEVGGASGTIAAGQHLPQNITLEPQATLIVTVTNFDNQPMAGAKVNVTGKRNGFTRTLPEAIANGSGVAVVEHVLADTFTATGSANGMSTTVNGTVTPNEAKAVTITLQGKSAITGTVFEPNGQQKASGGHVAIRGGGASATIAADGTYRIADVSLSTGYTLDVTDANNILRASAANVAVTTPGVDVPQNFTMVGIGTVKGRVVNGSNGVSGVSVSVRSFEPTFGLLRSVSTDPDGYYVMTNVIAGLITASAQSGTSYGELSGTLTHNDTLTLNLALVPNSQTLPVTKYDANNTYFDIQRGIDLGTGSNGFYNAFQLDVVANGSPVRFAGTTATGTQEDGGREVVNRQTIGGLNVTRKVFVPRAGYFGRWLEILSNPTSQPITVDLRVTTGIGGSQRWGANVITTSSGDNVLAVAAADARDRWVVMDDSRDGDPADVAGLNTTAVVFDGPGATDVPGAPSRVSTASFTVNSNQVQSDTLRYEWQSVTIAPGQTVAYMHFGVRQITRASASASAARLVQLPPEALVGLSLDELQSIRNFAIPANGQSTLTPLPAINGSVSGKLIAGDHTTVVLPGVWVYLHSDSLFYPRTYSAFTSNGAFSFTSAFGDTSSSNVSISTGDAFTVDVQHPQTKVPAQTHASFAPNASTAVADVVFENTSILKGQVQRHTGAAATGASVDFSMPGMTTFTTATASTNGNYAITGIPVGTYTVAATYTTSGPQFVLSGGFTGTSVAGAEVTRNVTLVPTGGVKGRVKKADGSFPSGFLVGMTDDNFAHTHYVNSTSGGNFSFANVPVGQWTLFATDSQVQTRVPVTVVVDTDTSQDLDLLAYRNVTATVRFPDGSTPAGTVPVRLAQAGFTDKWGNAVNGVYTFTNVAGGTPFTIRAWTATTSSYYGDSTPQTFTTIGTPLEVPVTLPALATLRITVMQGPNKGANVSVYYKTAFDTTLRGGYASDVNGQISYTDIPQGPVQIEVRSGTNVVLGTGIATIQATDHGKTVDATVSVGIILPRTLSDLNAFSFDIQKEGHVNVGKSNSNGRAYDSAVKLSVVRDGQTAAFANTTGFASLEAEGRQFVITQPDLQGLNVTRKIYVPTDGYFARYVDSFTNAGPDAVTVDVQVATDPFSNGSTVIVDQVPSQYLVTDDDAGTNASTRWPDSDPTLAHVYGGPGGAQLPIETMPAPTTGVLTYKWNSVKIEKGQTVAFMHFAVQQATQEAATASAQRLVQLPPEAIANLTVDERRAIRNFDVPEDGSSVVPPLVIQRNLTVTGKPLAYDNATSMNGTTAVHLRSSNPIASIEVTSKQSPYTLTTAVADGWVLTADNTPPSPFTGWTTSAMPIAGVVDGSTTAVAQDIAFTNVGGASGSVGFGNPVPLPNGRLWLSFADQVFNWQLVDGKFNLLAVPPGTHTGTAILDDGRSVAKTFTVTAGKSTDVVLELPARATVQIAVKNPNGSPASHASVHVEKDGSTSHYPDWGDPSTRSITDVSEGPFTVTAYSSDSHRSAVVTGAVTRTDEGKTIVVTPRLNAIADLLVTAKSGDQPMPNVSVLAKYPGYDEFSWACGTDEAGQCHVEMKEGDYVIQIATEDQIVLGSHSGHVGPADDGQTIPVTIQVPTDFVRISGTVYAADGVTPAHVVGDWDFVGVELVDVATGSIVARRSAYQGAYDFAAVPARDSIIVRAISPFDPSVTVQQTVTLNASEVTADLTLPLSVVKGRVLRATGEAMPSYVQITSEDNWAHTNTAGDDAHFAFVGLPAGSYQLSANSYAHSNTTMRVVTLASNAAVVDHDLIFNVVKGKVTFHSGEAVASPDVVALQPNAYGSEDTIFPVMVAPDGSYEIEGIQPGPFTIVANTLGLEGSMPGTMTDNMVLDNMNVTLEDDGTITGTFTTADGSQPILNARVILSLPNVERETRSDATNGTFEFKHVKLSAFALYGQEPSSGLVAKAAGASSAAQHDRTVPLRLPQTGTVTGQVVSGAPPAGIGPAELLIENRDNDGPFGRFLATPSSGANGSFSFDGVPVGEVSVMAFVNGIGGQARGTLSAGTPLTVQVPLGTMRKLATSFDLASAGFKFDVSCEGRILHGGKTDGSWWWTYGNAFRLRVDEQDFPCAFAGALEDGDRELVIPAGRVNGLEVTRKVYVPASGGYARYLEVISNPGLGDKNVTITMSGSIPSFPSRPALVRPVSTGDTYAVLMDTIGGGGQGFAFSGPNVTTPGLSAAYFVEGNFSVFQYTWTVKIPAGQTRILMHFAQQAESGNDAVLFTQQFPSLTRPDVLSGMTAEEKAAVVNFAIQ